MELEMKNTVVPTPIIEHWQRFVDTIADLLSVPSAMTNLVDPPELAIFRFSSNSDNPFPSGTRMELAGIYCAAAMQEKQKLQVVDARKDPVWADSPTAKSGIFAYIGYPIYWPGGEVFGTICAVHTKKNKWGKRFERLPAGGQIFDPINPQYLASW